MTAFVVCVCVLIVEAQSYELFSFPNIYFKMYLVKYYCHEGLRTCKTGGTLVQTLQRLAVSINYVRLFYASRTVSCVHDKL